MSGSSVLDVSESNIQQYAQGSFTDVCADIRHSVEPPDLCEKVISMLCEEFSIDGAFNLRRELIAFKKVLLRLSEKSARQSHTLTRLTTWLYGDIEFLPDGKSAETYSWVSSENYKISSDALHVSKGVAAALIEARGTMKSLCCIPRFPQSGSIASFGGVSGRKLARIPCGTSWWKTLKEANEFLESLGEEGTTDWEQRILCQCSDEGASLALGGQDLFRQMRERVSALTGCPQWTHFVDCVLIARGAWKACEMRFQALLLYHRLRCLAHELTEAQGLLRVHLQAQGTVVGPIHSKQWLVTTHGKKHMCLLESSLLVVGELYRWLRTLLSHTHPLSPLPSPAPCVTLRVHTQLSPFPPGAEAEAYTPVPTAGEPSPPAGCYRPLFIAGDTGRGKTSNSPSDTQAMYYPRAFEKLPAAVDRSSANIELLFPLFVSCVEAQPWPPAQLSSGGGVDAEKDTGKDRTSDLRGRAVCYSCQGHFSKIWIEMWLNAPTTPVTNSDTDLEEGRDGAEAQIQTGEVAGGVCCECVRRYKEQSRRCAHLLVQELMTATAALAGRKKKSVPAASAPLPCFTMFCPHRLYCVLHDGAGRGAFSCPLCALHKGDGGDVLELCSSLVLSSPNQRVLLFLDFDRTLCSTKSGADPDPVYPLDGATPAPGKQRTVHSIDDELREAVRASGVHQTYVVTRNSHGHSICRYLAKNDCPVQGVHVVSRKSGKARTLPLEGGGSNISSMHPTADVGGGASDFCLSPCFEKSKNKANVVLRLMEEARAKEGLSGCGVAGVFVDDDIRELNEGGEDLAAAGVHRFLFSRGAL